MGLYVNKVQSSGNVECHKERHTRVFFFRPPVHSECPHTQSVCARQRQTEGPTNAVKLLVKKKNQSFSHIPTKSKTFHPMQEDVI